MLAERTGGASKFTRIEWWLAVPLVIFAFTSIDIWHTALSWHDQQRIYQLVLLGVAAILLANQPIAALPSYAFYLLMGVFGLGLLSVALAESPAWALREWGRYAGLTILALLISILARRPRIFIAVLALMALIGSLHVVQFAASYIAAVISDVKLFTWDLLSSGFSQPRFFAQFQILLMPILAALALQTWSRRPNVGMLLTAVLVTQWCIGLMLGGRGLWLGLAASSTLLLIVVPRYWRLVAVQSGAALIGGLLYVLLLQLIPTWLNVEPVLGENLRTTLNGREHLWGWAYEMAASHPWLGVGPMHYSATHNPIAAHPHQAVLQWAAEWGWPATLMVAVICVSGLVFSIAKLRQGRLDNIGAALWLAITGALTLAQVDGVFVMPYVETWLAVLIGLCLARWSRPGRLQRIQPTAYKIMAIVVVVVVADVLINEVPTLQKEALEYQENNSHRHLQPRFWRQGWLTEQIAE